MLVQLRHHLIKLSTILTSMILSISLFTACYMNCSQRIFQKRAQYDSLQNMINTKFASDHIISNNWLNDLEVENNLLLHIEENLIPYSFRGSWTPPVDKTQLFAHAQTLADKDTSFLNESPLLTRRTSSSSVSSFSFTIHKDRPVFHSWLLSGIPVFSSITKIPTSTGFISVTMVQLLPQLRSSILQTIVFFGLLNLIGILSLYFISKYLFGKALRPVIDNHKKQTEFIAAASHDLRTPLAVIQSNASALLLPDAEVSHFAPKILDSCSHMSRLVTDLLSLAASDAKTWKLHIEEIDTEAFLIEQFDSFTSYCANRSHRLTLDLPDDVLPSISADKVRIQQILGILIDNALSYSPINSEIIIRPSLQKKTFCLEVIDYGQGIAIEEREKVFCRFYRSDKSRTDQKHFGLGLSIANELVELQKGSIHIKDTPGGGATFIVSLPVKE